MSAMRPNLWFAVFFKTYSKILSQVCFFKWMLGKLWHQCHQTLRSNNKNPLLIHIWNSMKAPVFVLSGFWLRSWRMWWCNSAFFPSYIYIYMFGVQTSMKLHLQHMQVSNKWQLALQFCDFTTQRQFCLAIAACGNSLQDWFPGVGFQSHCCDGVRTWRFKTPYVSSWFLEANSSPLQMMLFQQRFSSNLYLSGLPFVGRPKHANLG